MELERFGFELFWKWRLGGGSEEAWECRGQGMVWWGLI